MVFYTLSISSTTKLISPLPPSGSLILFQSSLLNTSTPSNGGTDNTTINLFNADGDHVLHISLRRKQNAIVFNTRKSGKDWDTEERETLEGKFTSNTPSILVYEHPDRYQVLFDFQTVKYFNKRIDGPTVEVGYGTNEGQASSFSDQLGVNTYNSLANLLSGPI